MLEAEQQLSRIVGECLFGESVAKATGTACLGSVFGPQGLAKPYLGALTYALGS